ncbi:MAG: tetratricopeptide repeat protein, partial [Alistipes putredinis]
FYREYYPQLNTLASTLAVRYPQDRRVVELYAKHLIASGELEQALALYKLHLDDQPPVEEYFRSVIDIESYLQHPDSVNRYIGRALELFPGQVDFHLSKGHTLNYSKQYPQAIKAYKQSLGYARTDSLRSVIWGFIGDTWHQKATAGEQDIDDNFARAVRKGSFRADMKQCYKAYDHSLRYDPDNAMVLNNYAYFLSLEGRELEKALTMSSRAIALTDNNPTYLDTHAWVLFKLGRTAEAKKVMQQAIALDGQESAALLVHYGDILHAMGEQFMAEIYWRKGLEKGYDADQITRRMEQGKAEKE